MRRNVRIHANEKKLKHKTPRRSKGKQTRKTISELASFPELNPNPVVEADFDGQILYLNPDRRKASQESDGETGCP